MTVRPFLPLSALLPTKPALCVRALAMTAACAVIAGCATGPEASPADPLEPMNRAVFTVNDKVDEYVAVPVAKGYRAVTPQPVRTAVTNFFSNLSDVGNFANNVLQGKGVDAAETLMRVAINSVLGLGGLIDIATPAGLQKHSQDFGLTLGVWGVPSGPYLVLPFFGPSSFRDGVGLYVNFWFDPIRYTRPAVRNAAFGLNVVDTRTNLLGATDLVALAALDKYTFVRDGYLQRRQYLIDGGRSKLPTYEEEEEGQAMPGEGMPAAPGAPASAPAAPAAPAPTAAPAGTAPAAKPAEAK